MNNRVISDKQSVTQLLNAFARTTEEVITLDELRARLLSGKQLRIKYGVDVTAPQMHIGHAVNLWMLRALQEMGHKVIFLIGDFTTQIGDPTGKNKTRPIIPTEEINANADAFIRQVGEILLIDESLVEVRRNSEWMDSFSAKSLLQLLQMVTYDRLVSRDMFRRRIQGGAEIYMHELTYPLIQGYDSVAIDSDMTIIGTDQLFNEMMGRFYQEKFDQAPQIIITTKITPGIDGKEKQSKSLGNYIGLDHDPREKFGRLMSIPDDLIVQYFEVYTRVDMDEITHIKEDLSGNPMVHKKTLAEAVVARYHGAEVAAAERSWFEKVFSERQIPKDLPEVRFNSSPVKAFDAVRACLDKNQYSNSQIRRLFTQNAVQIGGTKVTNIDQEIDVSGSGVVFKIGRRNWYRVIVRPLT